MLGTRGVPMLRHPLTLDDVLAELAIDDVNTVQFTVEADDVEDRHFEPAQFQEMITYIQEIVQEGRRTLTLDVTWDGGDDYFDLDAEIKAADQFLIELLDLQGWEVIC